MSEPIALADGGELVAGMRSGNRLSPNAGTVTAVLTLLCTLVGSIWYMASLTTGYEITRSAATRAEAKADKAVEATNGLDSRLLRMELKMGRVLEALPSRDERTRERAQLIECIRKPSACGK